MLSHVHNNLHVLSFKEVSRRTEDKDGRRHRVRARSAMTLSWRMTAFSIQRDCRHSALFHGLVFCFPYSSPYF